MIEKPSAQPTASPGIPGDEVLLLPLKEAATRIAQPPAKLLHMARIRDIDSVQVGGEFFFRPSALTEWVKRYCQMLCIGDGRILLK
jgi:hypothetical protein